MGMSKASIENKTNEMLASLKTKGIDKTTKQMASEISEAVKDGLPMRMIDDTAKYCGKICKNEPVSEYHIVRIYSNLMNTGTSVNKSEPLNNDASITKSVTNNVTKHREKATNMQKEIDTLKEQVSALQEQVKALQEQNKTITNNVTNTITNTPLDVFAPTTEKQKVFGFILRYESSTVNGCVYKNWFAKKTIAGKLHRIFVGKTTDKAEAKIQAYCQAKGVAI